MTTKGNNYKKIVNYNIDEVFLVTLQFAFNLCGFIYLAKMELQDTLEWHNSGFNDKEKLIRFQNSFMKNYEDYNLQERYVEPYIIEAVKSIPELSSDDLIYLHNKVKAVKVGGQIELNLSEMIILYSLLHLSCLSFISGIDDFHRHHSDPQEYGELRKIILTSMKLFMSNISEWINEYDAFIITQQNLDKLSQYIKD